MLEHSRELLERMLDPLALVSRTGETLEANRAFHRLAARRGVPPVLSALFGAELQPLLEQALRETSARATLQAAAGPEPRPWFRVLLAVGDPAGALVASLVDVTEEMAWRLDREQDLAMLNEVGTALSGAVELDELIERIHAQTTRFANTTNFFIALYDQATRVVSFPRYVEDGEWKQMSSRSFANGLIEHIIRTGEPLLLNDRVAEQTRALGAELIGRPCRSWLGVPMLAAGEVIGVIGLKDYEHPNRFDRDDIQVLGVIAGQAAAAIRNSGLIAAAQRAYRELSETQARLLETERVRGVTEAVGSMNHEVNNPLAAITGNAQLLLRHPDLAPAFRSKIDSILEAARRIHYVTTKMGTLIQATSRSYPGRVAILDIDRSVSREDPAALFPIPSRSRAG